MSAGNCIFCEILYGAEPATTVYDGIANLGIVPLNPVAEGHVIFIPRKHVRDAAEDPSTTASVMGSAAEYVKHCREAGRMGDANIITSIGPAATQSVFHLHIHVVPRSKDDGLALPWYSGKGGH